MKERASLSLSPLSLSLSPSARLCVVDSELVCREVAMVVRIVLSLQYLAYIRFQHSTVLSVHDHRERTKEEHSPRSFSSVIFSDLCSQMPCYQRMTRQRKCVGEIRSMRQVGSNLQMLSAGFHDEYEYSDSLSEFRERSQSSNGNCITTVFRGHSESYTCNMIHSPLTKSRDDLEVENQKTHSKEWTS